MKPKVIYRSQTIGNIRVIKDFLPLPERLVIKDEDVKIIAERDSVEPVDPHTEESEEI